MKVTLLGHASILVEMEGVRCLMDPVFQDPFEDGAVVSCPQRAVHVDRLPPIDVLILSHSHLDHFDIPSLAQLPRSCEVLYPKDQAITYALEQLGFTKLHPAEPMTRLVFPRYELLTTHSNVSNVVEFGVLFKDTSGSFWNQVDTVLAPQTIKHVQELHPQIDLLFAMYASQNFGFFESKPLCFPFQMHEMNLATVAAIAPRMVVPGSAGFRFCGAGEWCNSFLFPISRERFIADLAQVAPGIRPCIANPGDVFEVEPDGVRHRPGAATAVTMLAQDTYRLRYDPTAPVPPLTDPNPDRYPDARLAQAVADCLHGFTEFLAAAYKDSDPVVQEYRRLGASYAIGVVFPDGHEQWLRVQLAQSAPQLSKEPAGDADAGHRIAASALAAWSTSDRSYFYLRAFSRKFTTLYTLTPAQGGVAVAPAEVTDLLGYYLTRKAQGAELALKKWLDLQLRPYRQPPPPPIPQPVAQPAIPAPAPFSRPGLSWLYKG